MKNRHLSYRWITGTVAGLTAFSGGNALLQATSFAPLNHDAPERFSLGEFAFHHEAVLGTSMELIVHAGDAENAGACEHQVLAEIERLRRILSTRDTASEISRVQKGSPIESRELAQVLAAYNVWSERTGGAINANMAGVVDLWKQAEREQRLPDSSSLVTAFTAPTAFNVDGLGKGFIVDRAVEVAKRFASSGLLNIGGDIRVWGNYPWRVGVADPRQPAENSPLISQFSLRDAAVATSGGYARYYSIAGNRYSHIIDPRTLQAVDRLASATVIAADCLTANALATAVCVLGKSEGERLVTWFNAAGYLLTDTAQPDARGGLLTTPTAAAPEIAASQPGAHAATWPKGFLVSVNLQIKAPTQTKSKRPYVAVWIEDANKKVLRTVTIWGLKNKYIPDLSHWYEAAHGDQAIVQSVSRATRSAGKYAIVWDGLDGKGKALPTGAYTICVEVNREHGHHAMQSVVVQCGEKPAAVKLPATAESEDSTIEYGPKQL